MARQHARAEIHYEAMTGGLAVIFFQTIDSSVGTLLLAARDAGLHAIEFAENRHPVKRSIDWQEGDYPLLARAHLQLDEYFAGTRHVFDLPLSPQGLSLIHI